MASLDFLDPRLRGPEASKSSSSKPQAHLGDDDDSEWEYEYSNTETETFYVTLDLSKADFKAQDQVKNNTFPSRGSWQIQKASEMFLNRRKVTNNASHNSGGSSAATSDAEREDEDPDEGLRGESRKRHRGADANGDGDGDDENGDGEDGANNNERVQILELHSENPIISYKGRVFSGQWCENLTTELLFTRHEDPGDDSPLPVLKNLEDGVDLLAASCSRITVTEQRFRPKVSERERQRASAHLPPTVIPPADPKATQERNDQRNFLADLIAVKRRRGETDDVTIIAQSMQGKLAKMKSKGLPISRRSRYVKANRPLIPVRGSEDNRPSRRGGRRRGSGRARGKWAFLPLEATKKGGASASAASGSPPAEAEAEDESASTPTPFRWDDLEGEQGGDSPTAQLDDIAEEDMGDEQDEDEPMSEDNDDNNDYDEEEEDEMDEDDD
ncbi:hypothetical protein F5Y08DRAFT_48593 [Xylaria arbuscula]|nr:hypothetical protein F5Y08DRAFT_48593 [Xylaria arbuscula]